MIIIIIGNVSYGQESPRGESTTTVCVYNYQLLAECYWINPMGNSYLQSTTTSYGEGRQRRKSNWLADTPTLYRVVPTLDATCKVQIDAVSAGKRTSNLPHTRRPPSLWGHSMRTKKYLQTVDFIYFSARAISTIFLIMNFRFRILSTVLNR